jgi:3'(2'), 5'-bisphosphate nucleotidase
MYFLHFALNYMTIVGMTTEQISTLLKIAIEAAASADIEILKVYRSSDFQAEAKGDNSPLTLADRKSHEVIELMLKKTNLPILSEEGKNIPYFERRSWDYFWLVDPLDGTKEFLKRNDEFTVNIALIHKGVPVLGVVSVPVSGDTYYSSEAEGAFVKRNGVVTRLPKRAPANLSAAGLRVVASRSHMSEETRAFVDKLEDPVLVSKGSSLKFTLLAEGNADVYPRYAPTMEWDTAAAQAVVNGVGLKVYEHGRETELLYNKENLLNPWFLVR